MARCIRKPQIVDPNRIRGPRENPEAWCGRRFDMPCTGCKGSGRAKNELGETKICKRCHGRGLEPVAGDDVPISIEEAISGAKGESCAKCRSNVAEAIDRAS